MFERAFSKIAMPDLAAAGTGHSADFADGERREGIMQHEALRRLRLQAFDALLVALGAERRRRERLRLASGKEARSMRSRQYADLAGDRADRRRVSSVETDVIGKDHLAHFALLDILERPSDKFLFGSIALFAEFIFQNCFHAFFCGKRS